MNEQTIFAILKVIEEAMGLATLIRYLAKSSPSDQVKAMLDAEYAAMRATVDAEARATLVP